MGIKSFIITLVQQAVSEVVTKEISTRIDKLEATIDTRMNQLNTRMDNVEKELTYIRGILEGEARLLPFFNHHPETRSPRRR